MAPAADPLRAETLVAVDAVRWALVVARHGLGAGEITSKGGRDLVTATDIAVEDAIRCAVAEAHGGG